MHLRVTLLLFCTLPVLQSQILGGNIFDDRRKNENFNSNGNSAQAGGGQGSQNGTEGQEAIVNSGISPETLKFISEFLGPVLSEQLKQPSTLELISSALGLGQDARESENDDDFAVDQSSGRTSDKSNSDLEHQLRLVRVRQIYHQLKLQNTITKLNNLSWQPRVEQTVFLQHPPSVLDSLSNTELLELRNILQQHVTNQKRTEQLEALNNLRILVQLQNIQAERRQQTANNREEGQNLQQTQPRFQSRIGRSSNRYTLRTLGNNSFGINANVVIPNTDVDVISNVNVNTNLNGRGQRESEVAQTTIRTTATAQTQN